MGDLVGAVLAVRRPSEVAGAVVVAAPVQVADLVTGGALAVVGGTDDAGDADGSPTGERADREFAVALGGQRAPRVLAVAVDLAVGADRVAGAWGMGRMSYSVFGEGELLERDPPGSKAGRPGVFTSPHEEGVIGLR